MTEVAALSVSEQITLRRVALGQSRPGSLSVPDLQRLRALGLIEGSTQAPVVTASGRTRFESLARPIALAETSIEDALTHTLESLRQGRRQQKRRP